MHRRAALGVVAIAASWGTIGLFVRWVDLPAVAIVFSRCALAAVVVGGWLAARRARAGRRPRRPVVVPRWSLALLGVGLAVHWLCLVGAQQRAPIGTVLLITYLAPVLVTVLAPRLLHERVPSHTYVAAGLGLVGVAVLVGPGAGIGAGELLAVLAAVTYAAITLGAKAVVGAVGGVHLAFVQFAVAAVVLLPFALAADWGPPSASWWWLVLVGAVLTGVLGSVYFVLLDRLPAATVSVLTYVEPVAAVVVAWLFLDEVPTVTTVLGGLLVVAAGMMVIPRARRPVAARDRSVPSGAPR